MVWEERHGWRLIEIGIFESPRASRETVFFSGTKYLIEIFFISFMNWKSRSTNSYGEIKASIVHPQTHNFFLAAVLNQDGGHGHMIQLPSKGKLILYTQNRFKKLQLPGLLIGQTWPHARTHWFYDGLASWVNIGWYRQEAYCHPGTHINLVRALPTENILEYT